VPSLKWEFSKFEIRWNDSKFEIRWNERSLCQRGWAWQSRFYTGSIWSSRLTKRFDECSNYVPT
jgi:hypothetical protein